MSPCLLVLILLTSCAGTQPRLRYETDPTRAAQVAGAVVPYPAARFAVLSDPHLFDGNLGTEGPAFEGYLANDRKLLRESGEILEAAMQAIAGSATDFVLVPGDLTKDGEATSHRLVAERLRTCEAGGRAVYVVPGNHDVLNGHSFRYAGDTSERVPNVTAEEFARIYADFGYGEALYRDAASLSYVVEPKPGLWLLALDACLHRENREDQEPHTGGKFLPETLTWIEDRLAEATQKKVAVMAMMHHGVLEHYKSQIKNYRDYIVGENDLVSRLLATYHVRLVFTGHYHAQDVSLMRWSRPARFLYDIETGSLVSFPSSYRTVEITPSQKAVLRSYRIGATKSHPSDFEAYGLEFTREGIAGIAARTIQEYGIKQQEAEGLASQISEAFLAHYAGDEQLAPGQRPVQTRGLTPRARLVLLYRGDLIQGLWRDLEPPDNELTIDLMTGNWR